MEAGSTSSPLADADMANAIYAQAMTNWIEPEILLRHERGEVELPMEFNQAQIIFGIDGSHLVRLNGEVKGEIKARINRPVEKGELLYNRDIDEVVFSQLAPEDEGYGHITMISYSQGDSLVWSVSFSFIYGATRVTQYLDLGKDFLGQAEATLPNSHRATIALAMTAAENLIKARISASPRLKLTGKTHDSLMSLFSRFIKDDPLKSLDQSYVDTYKFFKSHFNGVRYEPTYKNIHRSTIKKHLHILRQLHHESEVLVLNMPSKSLSDRTIKLAPRT